MSKLLVLQHTESEFLGLIEDHLETRRIGFQYIRPFVDQAWQLKLLDPLDGLVLLGGGPWGTAGSRDLPSLDGEVELCQQYLAKGRPVLGFGVGAQILALATGGTSQTSPLEFKMVQAIRQNVTAAEFLPDEFDLVRYGRDMAVPSAQAQILAVDQQGAPLVFQVNDNSFGFLANPGVKSGIIEDLIMEFEEVPDDTINQLQALRNAHPRIERSLSKMMIGLIKNTGWMLRNEPL